MSVTWDEDLLDRVRERAAAGRSMRQAAADLHVPLTSLAGNASDHKIKFHGSRFIPPPDRPMASAREDLTHQIRLALVEAALAQLYRRWPDDSASGSAVFRLTARRARAAGQQKGRPSDGAALGLCALDQIGFRR